MFSLACVSKPTKLLKCNNFGESWLDIELDFECEIHHCFPRNGGSPTAFKVLNLATEPSIWCLSSDDVRSLSRHFNLILAYRKDLLDLPNVRFFLFGGSWIDEIPREKRFEVSFLYSVGANSPGMDGYSLRENIWSNRKQLPEFFKYYSSTKRPPKQNDNPWPFISKNKLYESMFSLTIENTAEENYFTEKLIDSLQTFTVPIYYGCPNISDYFDTRGFIIFNDVGELAEILNNLTPKDYYDKYDSILSNYLWSNKYRDMLSNIKVEIVRAHRLSISEQFY